MGTPERIAIIGPGLLGGSLVYALRAKAPEAEVRIWGRREAPLETLRRNTPGVFASSNMAEVLEGASLVVLATPVETMEAQMEAIARQAMTAEKPMIVTDVGSVKGMVVQAAEKAFRESPVRFVGSHPMAGSEQSGVEAARVDLFDNALCILTPSLSSDPLAIEVLRRFWTNLGCRLTEGDPQTHDRILGHISHYPHLQASIAVLSALQADADWGRFAGNGFKDTTRVASGDPHLWAGILMENRTSVMEALHTSLRFQQELLLILAKGDKEALAKILAKAKQLRDRHYPNDNSTS